MKYHAWYCLQSSRLFLFWLTISLLAVFSVNNPETSQRTRHLDVRYFKVRDYIKQQAVRVRHISTNMNVADFFTKGLDRVLFTRYRDCLGMEDHTP